MQEPAIDVEGLTRQIKRNCDISDAKFWGYYSVCGLLMRMRDLFRSERGLMPWDPIAKEEIYPWIDEHDGLWNDLETAEQQPLMINGSSCDPFDTAAVNQIVRPLGLCYSGGFGAFRKPAFFLSELAAAGEIYDYQVHYLGRELCRDLAAYPAMFQGRCIFVRREIVKAMIWERLSCTDKEKCRSLHDRIERSFGFSAQEPLSAGFEAGMEALTRRVSEIFLFHELGEAFEEDQSPLWQDIIGAPHGKLEELYLRGVTDLLADTSDFGTLQGILRNADSLLLDFYLLFLDGIRRELFSDLLDRYCAASLREDLSALERVRRNAYARASLMKKMISDFWQMNGTLKGIHERLRMLSAPERPGKAAESVRD